MNEKIEKIEMTEAEENKGLDDILFAANVVRVFTEQLDQMHAEEPIEGYEEKKKSLTMTYGLMMQFVGLVKLSKDNPVLKDLLTGKLGGVE